MSKTGKRFGASLWIAAGLLLLVALSVGASSLTGGLKSGYGGMHKLYADCSLFYVPAQVREKEDWIRLQRCSNFIDAVLLASNLPPELPVKRADGAATTLVCPRPDAVMKKDNSRLFPRDTLVETYIEYWDQQNPSLMTRLFRDSSTSVVEAFAPRYGLCFDQAQSS